MKKLLIAEDEAILRNVLVDRFSEDGWDVTAVENGDEALDKITAYTFDLILLDIIMPVKDGLEVLKELSDSSAKDTPVIVLTNLGTDEDKKAVEELGAKGYFIKSQQTIDELIKKVNSYVK